MTIGVLTVCGSLQRSSANRAALDVAAARMAALGAAVDEYDELALIPPLNVDPAHDAGPVVAAWRRRLAAADVVLLAAPEYAGALAGTIKNALDWVVGTGELYAKPVAVISAGTSGGVFARQGLIQTLTWQGAHVVAELGIAAPRTRSDAAGRYTDAATLAAIEALAETLLAAPALAPADRLADVRRVVDGAGVDPVHIAPVV